MKVLITGSNGFIGKNLVSELHNRNHQVYQYDIDAPIELLNEYCKDCEFVFHLAGVNRSQKPEEFMKGNCGLTEQLLFFLKNQHNSAPVMIASSIQASLDNDYGKSKLAGEQLLRNYSVLCGIPVYIFRFSNVFGKWCRPNYNSVIATFCFNISRGLPIQINNSSTELTLVYIDDVIDSLLYLLDSQYDENEEGFCIVPASHQITLGEIVDLLYQFKDSRNTLEIPHMPEGSFEKKLYSTYLSYLPENDFSYPLHMNQDARGCFTELLNCVDGGQVSVNITKPGYEKGNHWHHTKNEKFIVVSGEALIQLRKVGTNAIIEYYVSGKKMEVVDIPGGYTHNIKNTGNTDLVTIMWSNECYNPEKPDTYYLKVNED